MLGRDQDRDGVDRDHWKPAFFLLESEGLNCVLYHAVQVKALPGRPKTDLLTELLDVSAAQRGCTRRQLGPEVLVGGPQNRPA